LELVGHGDIVLCVVLSVDGSKIASGSHDGTCKVWDSSTGVLLHSFEARGKLTPFSVAWGRDWVRDTQAIAFAMGHHPRLGAGSQVLELEVGVVRMILDHVWCWGASRDAPPSHSTSEPAAAGGGSAANNRH
jgi:WD40 repeat protein